LEKWNRGDIMSILPPGIGWLGKLSIFVCGLAAYIAYDTHSSLTIFAVINFIANFWSLGIMWNYRGDPYERSNYVQSVIIVNMITSGLGLIFLIIVLLTE
jgi:hypothetical protein